MEFEYLVQTIGGSAFDNLERLGSRVEEALNGEDSQRIVAHGWELWQVNTLKSNEDIKGILLIYRRAKKFGH